MIRCVHNQDDSCFYWSLILALRPFRNVSSYDNIERIRHADLKKYIRTLRKKVYNWWHKQPPHILYEPTWRWMVDMETFRECHSMEVAKTICTNHDLAPLIMKFMGPDYFENGEDGVLAQRIKTLIQQTLLTEAYVGLRECRLSDTERSNAYYEYLRRWSQTHANVNTNDGLKRKREEVSDDTLKSVAALIIEHIVDEQFSALRICEYGNNEGTYRFHKKILKDILNTNEGAQLEECIAIAAIYKKPLFVLFVAEHPMDTHERITHVRLNEQKWIQAIGTLQEDPFSVTYVSWDEARPYVEKNDAIVISEVMTSNDILHADAVCEVEMPSYISIDQLEDIEDADCMLRSLSNVPYPRAIRFLYALMLTCAPMRRGFRYCCTLIHKSEFDDWKNKIKSMYVDWWLTPSISRQFIGMHAASAHSNTDFVYYRDPRSQSGDIDLDEEVDLDEGADLVLNVERLKNIKYLQMCKMWESAVVFAHILRKTCLLYTSPSPRDS